MSAAVAPEQVGLEVEVEVAPVEYDRAAIVERVCLKAEDGGLIREAIKAEGIDAKRFYGWLEADPYLYARFARARILQAHALAERVLTVATDKVPAGDMAAVQMKRLEADSLKWFTAKIAPKLYGEKVMHDHEHRHAVVLLPALDADQGSNQAGGSIEGPGAKGAGTTLPGSRNGTRARLTAFASAAPAEILALADAGKWAPDSLSHPPVAEQDTQALAGDGLAVEDGEGWEG